MSRPIILGNGNLLIGLDSRGQVRDFYFPFAGHSNHVSGASGSYAHRVGIWVDGVFSWLSDEQWSIKLGYSDSSGTSDIFAHHASLGVSLHFTDAVHNERNIFLRKVVITNEHTAERTIRIFFGQEFRISESRRGDTAFYDPRVRSIIHYKGHHTFLISASIDEVPFTDYSVGIFGIEGKQGTYTDAEDGVLSKNPIEHGSADSVIGLEKRLEAHGKTECYYWVVAGKTIRDVHMMHQHVLEERPGTVIESTEHYWHAWSENEVRDLRPLPRPIEHLYKRSLAVIRFHTDNRGGIIASSDSEILNQGRDTYSYVWPRDGAYTAHALDRAGHIDVTQRFFNFMSQCMDPEGYFMHKYRVDGVLGSSWHPWVQHDLLKLPIQEDETAVVLYMLAEHYKYAKDLEFIESLYNSCIEPGANFLASYIDAETGLPIDSYDLWEEKYGSSTYTAATVYGALNAVAELSVVLGKRDNAQRFRDCAERLQQAMLTYLLDPQTGMFLKLVRHDRDGLYYDRVVDMSSIFGIVAFGVLDVFDRRVTRAFDAMIERLKVPGPFGGYMRYEGDQYYKTSESAPPNAWCITTLWVAQYYIKTARKRDDLKRAQDLLTWVCERATMSGMLPEQIDPNTGRHLSTTPLVWSHAEFVTTVDEYIKKYKSL